MIESKQSFVSVIFGHFLLFKEIKEFYPTVGSLLSYTHLVKFTTQGVEDALFVLISKIFFS